MSMSRNAQYLIVVAAPQAVLQPSTSLAFLMHNFQTGSWDIISVDENGADLSANTPALVSNQGDVIYEGQYPGVKDANIYIRSASGATRKFLSSTYEESSTLSVRGFSADGTKALIRVANRTQTSHRIFNTQDGSVQAYLPSGAELSFSALSSSGRYAIFATLASLNESDTNSVADVYLFDSTRPNQYWLLSKRSIVGSNMEFCYGSQLFDDDSFTFKCFDAMASRHFLFFGYLSNLADIRQIDAFYGFSNDGKYLWSKIPGGDITRTDADSNSLTLHGDIAPNSWVGIVTDPRFLLISADGNTIVFTVDSANLDTTTYPYELNYFSNGMGKYNIMVANITAGTASVLMQPECRYRNRQLCSYRVSEPYQWYLNHTLLGVAEANDYAFAISADGKVAMFTAGYTSLPGTQSGNSGVNVPLGWVVDINTGVLRRVMETPTKPLESQISHLSLSADGRRAAFRVDPSPFAGCDNALHYYDVVEQTLHPLRTNITEDGPIACQYTSGTTAAPILSADGNYIAWEQLGVYFKYNIAQNVTKKMAFSLPAASFGHAGSGGDRFIFSGTGDNTCFVNWDGSGETCDLVVDVDGNPVSSVMALIDVSKDGRFVGYYTNTKILPEVDNDSSYVYVRDRVTNRTTAARYPSGFAPSIQGNYLTCSQNGQYWLFRGPDKDVILHDHFNNKTLVIPKLQSSNFAISLVAHDSSNYFGIVTDLSLDYRDVNAINDAYRCRIPTDFANADQLECQILSVAPGFFTQPPADPPVATPVASPVEPPTTTVRTGEPPSTATEQSVPTACIALLCLIAAAFF